MLGVADGATPGSLGRQSSATAAAAEVKADRLARELEEAEEQISAMSSQIKQQVNICLHPVVPFNIFAQHRVYVRVCPCARAEWVCS